MGEVFAEITLRNWVDVIHARDGSIPEQNIRSFTVTALVDTGANTLVMDEKTREKLGLRIDKTDFAILAGGSPMPCSFTEPVEICWKNRTSFQRAMVLPGQEEVLLGVIPLEDMDLMVDPTTRQLVGAHGEKQLHRVL